MMRLFAGLLAALLIAQGAPAQPATSQPAPTQPAPLVPVAQLDVARYMGTWYQVALYPNRFQAQCARNTTATYRLLADNTLEVVNRCVRADGTADRATGQARPTGVLQGGVLAPATLQVRFAPAWLSWLPWVWGNYWVVQLADDYRYAVISEPARDYLWVLSRKPQLDAADEAVILARLQAQGFDTAKLQRSPQD